MNSNEVHFLSAIWLWFLPAFWLYLFWWFTKIKEVSSVSIADADSSAHNHFYHPLADQIINSSENKMDDYVHKLKNKFWLKPVFWWQGLAISSLIIALAEPVLIGERLPDPPPERDIVFLVDTSVSMQLKDYSLNDEAIKRMDLLRKLLDEFTIKMEGEHISVIVFAESPYVLVPLTNDQNLIRRMLSRVTTSLAGRYTAVGDALLMALKEANKQSDRHQTFILFTDADESRGQVTSLAAARLVAEKNIPVYTIAIGSSQKENDKDVKGGLYQAVNLSLLKEISETTDAESYQVHDSQAIQDALRSILSQRQNLSEVEPYFEHKALYFYPLILGLLMLVLFSLFKLLGFGFLRAES